MPVNVWSVIAERYEQQECRGYVNESSWRVSFQNVGLVSCSQSLRKYFLSLCHQTLRLLTKIIIDFGRVDTNFTYLVAALFWKKTFHHMWICSSGYIWRKTVTQEFFFYLSLSVCWKTFKLISLSLSTDVATWLYDALTVTLSNAHTYTTYTQKWLEYCKCFDISIKPMELKFECCTGRLNAPSRVSTRWGNCFV